MAVYDASQYLGDRNVRPNTTQLQAMEDADPGLYKCGMAALWRQVGYFQQHYTIHTDPNNNTKYSLAQTARVPFTVLAIDVGCESAAGSAATADIEKNPSGSPDTFATMSTGAVDIKTGAGDFVNLPVLAGAQDVRAGDELRLAVVGTGAGAVVGSQAVLHCLRL